MRLLLAVIFLCLSWISTDASQAKMMPLNFTLTVRVLYPDEKVQTMYIRGDSLGLNWDDGKLMTKFDENEWRFSLPYTENQIGSKVELKVLDNDRVWMIGSNYKLTLSPSSNSTVIIYPWFSTGQGKIQTEGNIYSPQFDNTRNLLLYLPPSYSENPFKTYENVIFMHDGNNLFTSGCSGCCPFGCWGIHSTLDGLIYSGEIEEVLIVGVSNTNRRMEEYTYSVDPGYGGGKGDLYLDFLEKEVLDVVKSKYRIQTDSLSTIGSSLGGLISCYAGWTRPEIWKKVGCMSSSFWWNNEDFLKDILPSNDVSPSNIYLDSGGPSDSYYETLDVFDFMKFVGKEEDNDLHHYADQQGQHNEASWGRRFHVPMTKLYSPKLNIPE